MLCGCGAPVRGLACQRGHRLQEAWSPEARAAAAMARKEHGGITGMDRQDALRVLRNVHAGNLDPTQFSAEEAAHLHGHGSDYIDAMHSSGSLGRATNARERGALRAAQMTVGEVQGGMDKLAAGVSGFKPRPPQMLARRGR